MSCEQIFGCCKLRLRGGQILGTASSGKTLTWSLTSQALSTQTSTNIWVWWVQVRRTASESKAFTFRCCPPYLDPPNPDICTCLCGKCMSYEFPCKCLTFRCCPAYLDPPNFDIHLPHKHVQVSGLGGSK
jgi:hypothetical protein